MRSDCKPCSRLMRQTDGIFTVGGAFGFWVLCRLHYGMENFGFWGGGVRGLSFIDVGLDLDMVLLGGFGVLLV